MSFFGDFGDMLPDTITVLPTASRNSYGEPVAGTPVPYQARVVHRTQVSLNDRGEEKTTKIEVIINTTATIAADSKIQLPSGAIESIFAVEVYRDDLNRPHHTVVRL